LGVFEKKVFLIISCFHPKQIQMKQRFLFTLAIGASLTIFSCSSEKAETPTTAASTDFNLDAVKTEIAASNATYGASFASGDSTAFVAHYTTDGCVMAENAPKLCGAGPITAFFKGGLQMGIKDIKLTTEEVMGGPDVVVETGTYEILGDKAVSFDKGKFIVAWKKENGKWKMHRDIWNTSNPAPAAK
jgi:ketosteroid isomerase-like protein